MADGTYSTEQLKQAARKAYLSGDLDAAKRLIDASRASESSRAPFRAGAQGLTFGFSDEAIAAATNPMSAIRSALGNEEGGLGYSERLQRERDALSAYSRDYPVESALAELGGAALPAAAQILMSGGTATPGAAAQTAPLISRAIQAAPAAAKTGAIYGGLYGAGSAEGGAMERLKGAAVGAGTGAVLGPVVGAATYPIVAGATQLADAARRTLGARGGKAVEAELQRLAEATGLSVDEIAQRVASGEIMAENATLRMATRALMARGGQGETMTRQTFDRRPPQKREEAMQEIQQYLSNTADDNVLRGTRMTQEQAKEAEKQAYGAVFGPQGGGAVAPEVSVIMADAFERLPGAAKELSAFVRADTKTNPYFTVADDGAVTFTRQPTLQEAELTRRFLAGKKSEAYRQGTPWGPVYENIEKNLRGALDATSVPLRGVRAEAAKIRSEADAFDEGQKLFNRSADEVEIMVEDLLRRGPDGEAQLAALRAGAMDALRVKSKGASGTSLMGTLTNPERKESAILRALLPPSVYDDVAQKMGVAAQSQAARGDIIKGPSTALTQAADKQLGSSLSAGELAQAASGNFQAMLGVGSKLVKAAAPGLSEKERMRVLGVLLSEDPNVVRRALRDESGMAALQAAVTRLAKAASGAAQAGAVVGGTRTINTELGIGGPQ